MKLTAIYSSAMHIPTSTSSKPTNITAKTSYKENEIDDFYSPFRDKPSKKLHNGSFEISKLKKKPKNKKT